MANSYCIVPIAEVQGLQWDKIEPKAEEFLTWNQPKTNALVRYVVGDKPSCLTGKTGYSDSTVRGWRNDPSSEWFLPDPT